MAANDIHSPSTIGIFPEPREVPAEQGAPGREDPFVRFFTLLQMRLTYQEREFIQDLYRIGQQWNPSLECIRDGHYVYVPHWGPFQGFTSVDYFYGMIRGRPMAKLMDDEESSISIILLRSAMPESKLYKRMTFLKRRIKEVIILRYNNGRMLMKQKLKDTQRVVPEIMKFMKPTFIP